MEISLIDGKKDKGILAGHFNTGLDFKTGIATGVVGAATLACIIDASFPKKYLPNVENVQQGYIAPSRLEVKVQDLDRNGELETVLHVDKIPYLLRELEGKPVLSAYEVKPAEIIPKDY